VPAASLARSDRDPRAKPLNHWLGLTDASAAPTRRAISRSFGQGPAPDSRRRALHIHYSARASFARRSRRTTTMAAWSPSARGRASQLCLFLGGEGGQFSNFFFYFFTPALCYGFLSCGGAPRRRQALRLQCYSEKSSARCPTTVRVLVPRARPAMGSSRRAKGS